MYTATDIRNVEFTKNMGGYKAAEVDAFVDACADTVEAMAAEKEELNKKLAILADKLVEYRRDEDSIRSALLSAQRMGDSVVREANEKAEAIVAEADAKAEVIVADAKKNIAKYESEMERLKKEINDFKATILSLYKEHLALLKQIPDLQQAVAAEAAVVVPVPEEEEQPVKIVEPEETEEAPVRKSKFTNLKFGEDYSLDQDEDPVE
ncbi:MAG: DivIVA domain-containing protein [Clostridia bacterium]|nr:DivIVA domain-containing protein [Clostridia bacterium]